MTIALTGATGQLGRVTVDALLTRGTPAAEVVAVGRSPEKLAALARATGVTTRTAAYGEADALREALAGVETLLLISSSEVGQRVEQHRSVIEAAEAVGVSRLVYTSAPRASTTSLVLAPDHKATEELLAASGLTTAVLRNNWYTEGYLPQLQQAAATGELVTGAGNGRVASASRRDFAEALAVAATDAAVDGRVLELGGDHAWDPEELAGTSSTLLGREVRLRSVGRAEHEQLLQAAGLDAGTAWFVAQIDADIAAGALAEVTGDLSGLIGRPTTPLLEGPTAARG